MVTEPRKGKVTRSRRWPAVCAALAVASCALTVWWTAAQLPGYAHSVHPVTWAGAVGQPTAGAFNVGAVLLPGVLALAVMLALRAALPSRSGWSARIGVQMGVLAALAFAAQAAWPLDPQALDGPTSRRHASLWMVWLLAWALACAALAVGLARRAQWRRLARSSVIAAVLGPVCALLLPAGLPGPLAQRLTWALWLVWVMMAGWQASVRSAPADDACAALR